MDLLYYETKIKNYKLLCSIKPHYKKSKYPYSHWTPEKITNTGNMIALVRTDKSAKKLVTRKKQAKRGGGMCKIFVFI